MTSVRIEVEGTGAALVKHDVISAEGLAVAGTGSGLGVAAAEDEAQRATKYGRGFGGSSWTRCLGNWRSLT